MSIEYNAAELKKLFYKKDTPAILFKVLKGVAYYEAPIIENDQEVQTVYFQIPVAEMGDAPFLVTMSAKHLIKWML